MDLSVLGEPEPDLPGEMNDAAPDCSSGSSVNADFKDE